MKRLRKLIRTAFTPLPTFSVGDSLSQGFSFRKHFSSCHRITEARLKLLLLVFATFCLPIAILVVI